MGVLFWEIIFGLGKVEVFNSFCEMCISIDLI